MFAFILVLLTTGCSVESPEMAPSFPAWDTVTGTCPEGGSGVIVSADDLGEWPIYMIEVETLNGWVPLSAPSVTPSPLLHRDEDGLWLTCPSGSWEYRASWIKG